VNNDKQPNDAPTQPKMAGSGFTDSDFSELQQDMRSAQITAWIQENQQKLVAGVVAFLVLLVGASLLIERNKGQKESISSLYQQAVETREDDKRKAMLEVVVREHGDSVQAAFAGMELARLDAANGEQHLRTVLDNGKITDEIKWQATLDLAELLLGKGDKVGAAALLAEEMGKAYEQPRQALLAQSAASDEEKKRHLLAAHAAESNDGELKASIERELSAMGVAIPAEPAAKPAE